MSRTKFAIKNTAAGVVSKFIGLLVSFVSRTVFIHILGNTYLGINGLYTEVLSVLSFAELGFGSALTYAMYAPVAAHDEIAIVKLMDYYKKVYRIIAGIVTVLGLVMLPFLPYVVKGADFLSLHDLRVYYLFFLFNTVISYFVTYKYSMINALQKNYIITNFDMIVNFVVTIAQIVVLLVFRNFLLYLATQSVLLLLSRVGVSVYLNRVFPLLRKKSTVPLSSVEKKPIIENVRGLVVHQFSSIAVHSTDNIIISAFSGMGIVAVGLVSNYNMIINSVLAFVVILFSSFTSGFGNMAATCTTEKFHDTFLELHFMGFWIYGFCCIAFFILIPPFITLWIGSKNLIDMLSFSLIVLNAYLMGQSTVYNNARIAKGNFNKDKWWSLTQAIVNLVVSIIGAKAWGLVGVYVGTVASRLVFVISRPYSTYRFLFDTSSKEYYGKLALHFAVVLIGGALTYFLTYRLLNDVTYLRFLLSCLIVAIIPNGVFLIAFGRTNECKRLYQRVKSIIKRGGNLA